DSARAPPKQQVKLGTMSGLSHRQRCALGHPSNSVPDERSAALDQPVQLPGDGGIPAGHDGQVALKCDGDRATGLTRQARRDDSFDALRPSPCRPASTLPALVALKRPAEQLAALVLRSWSPARVPAFGSSSCRIRSAVIWMEVSIPAFPGMLV